MPKLRVHNFALSLDGYAAGPNQDLDNPLGMGGLRLHDWVYPTRTFQRMGGTEGGEEGLDNDFAARGDAGIGATIMGRNMFGPIRGPWGDDSWRGWWGDDPPFHHPVFIVTHHARDPVTMQGGTSFTFVTDGIASALQQARDAAGDDDVTIAGGAAAVQQYLSSGLLDELYLHIVPIVLGAGERLLVDVGDPDLTPVQVVASPTVTHVRYRIRR
jgi:dihydrofolate reductase